MDVALRAYRLDRWEGQNYYAELWVEKAALAGVLEPLAQEFHVTLMVNKGYSSQSAMYESAQRIKAAWEDCGQSKDCVVFYLGDHDPSGQDMVRDVSDRLNKFTGGWPAVEVAALALTTEQVRRYDPPPNPTKLTDSRATGYIARHGYECWEVDALEPATLQRVIRSAFEHIVDVEAMARVKAREEKHRKKLQAAVKKL